MNDKKKGNRVRDERIMVTVTKKEKELIQNCADNNGMTMCAYLRWLAISGIGLNKNNTNNFGF